MTIIYQICEIAATSVETWIMLDFITGLLGSKYQRAKKFLVLAVSFLVINSYMLSVDYFSEKYAAVSDIIALALYIAYAAIFTKRNLIYRIIAPILCMTAIMVINITVHIMISSIFHIRSDELLAMQGSLRIIALLITKCTFFLVTRIVLKMVKPDSIRLTRKEFVAIFTAFFISVLMILFTAELQYSSKDPSVKKLTWIVLIGTIVINITIFILFSIIAKKNQEALHYAIMETRYAEQQKAYDSVRAVYNNLQILQHDMKNELLCIQNYVEQNQNAEAIRYIETLTNTRITTFFTYIKTGSEWIDMIINIKLNFAREQGIAIETNIGADFSGFEENDIVHLFANAMDNAIEASIHQKKKHIVLTIGNKRNYLCITIGNSVDTSVLKHNADLATTKPDKKHHGFGTQSMRNIVEKYDGMLSYYEKNEVFFLDIMMRRE